MNTDWLEAFTVFFTKEILLQRNVYNIGVVFILSLWLRSDKSCGGDNYNTSNKQETKGLYKNVSYGHKNFVRI